MTHQSNGKHGRHLPPRVRRLPPLLALLGSAAILVTVVVALDRSLPARDLGPASSQYAAGELGSALATQAPSLATPTYAATASPEPSATSDDASQSPSETPTDEQLSHSYWNSITHFGAYGFEYQSLAEITHDSHLVVRGRVIDLTPGVLQPFEEGGPHGEMSVTFGIVAVDEVLKGIPEVRIEGRIEVARLGWTGMSASDLPQHEVVLFLKNYAQMRRDEGVEQSEDSADRFYYGRPNGYQAVLRNIGGQVAVIVPREDWEEVFADGFPFRLIGRDFEDVVERIRQMVRDTQ